LKRDRITAAFLDTTFLLPFFQLDISVEAFDLNAFREFVEKLSEAHASELSIFEAKTKLLRLSRKDTAYNQVLENFGSNLAVLREDERFIFHPYTKRDDAHLNLISTRKLELDSFDAIIVAQSLDLGLLVTEDREIVSLKENPAFTADPTLGKLEIRRWKELRY